MGNKCWHWFPKEGQTPFSALKAVITFLMQNKTQLVLRWWQHNLFFILPLINYISKHLIFIQEENVCVTHLAWTMEQASAKHFMCKCMVCKFFTQLSAPQKETDYWIFSWALFTQTILRIQISWGGYFNLRWLQTEISLSWNNLILLLNPHQNIYQNIRSSGEISVPEKNLDIWYLLCFCVETEERRDLWERKFNIW